LATILQEVLDKDFNLKSKKTFVLSLTAALMLLTSCQFLTDFFSDGEKDDGSESLDSISLSDETKTVKVGEMYYITYTKEPSGSTAAVEWSYDSDFIAITEMEGGAVITGAAEGQSSLTVSGGGKSDTCIVTVSGFSSSYVDTKAPYIYSSTSIVQMQPGDSQNVHVSLYNGTVNDNENYTWTIDKSSVATISPTGQYCQIKAESAGYTRIKVVNTSAAYPYYIGLYVLEDLSKTTYVTTKSNIISLSKSEGDSKLTVDLVNPVTETYKSKFKYEILDNGSDYISITGNQDECVVTPLNAGQATIRVSNDEAPSYPLDIVVTVVEIVQNVHIVTDPSDSIQTVNGTDVLDIEASLEGLNLTTESYSENEFTFETADGDIAYGLMNGSQLQITGLANGSATFYIKHPCSKYSKQILVIVSGQTSSATDSSFYITTSQNYIKTKVGADDTSLSIMMKGGSDGDEKDFVWTVSQQPQEEGGSVISVTTDNGSVVNDRMASSTYAQAAANIHPEGIGTATITISHPKSYYTTEILVKVLSKDALLETPLYFLGDDVVKFLNSETYTCKVSLLGSEKVEGDDTNISWKGDSSSIAISSSGASAVLSSTATGSTISHVEASHPKAQYSKSVLVMTADTQEELDSLKAFYSGKKYYSINVGKTCRLYTQSVGYQLYDSTGSTVTDFSTVEWTSSNAAVATVEKDSESPLCATVSGLSAGTATIKSVYNNECSYEYVVTVYPESVSVENVESVKYLTTGKNVINISNAGETASASVSAFGITNQESLGIKWTSSNTDVASVIGNGTAATVTANSEGEAVLDVTLDGISENSLKIYVRVGSEYIVKTTAVKYISTSVDTVSIVKDSGLFTLTATLQNGTDSETSSGFSFSIDDADIAQITAQYPDGKCYIKPVSAGQASLTVKNSNCDIDKNVLVLVGNSETELSEIKYLTTSMNVITIYESETKTANVSFAGSSDVILDGYTWTSGDKSICDIVSITGSTAVLKGNAIGTTKLSVCNENCTYPDKPLEIIVQVVNGDVAAANPYIYVTNPVLTLKTGTDWTDITADLVGGSDDDDKDFEWSSTDETVVQCYGQNGVGKCKALKTGTAYIKVSHSKAAISQNILCICEETTKSTCSISVSCGNILSIKPDSGDSTITATLQGDDVETADGNNFKWSLDVYNVVELAYSAGTAVITPVSEGTCTLTVHHPKSGSDQCVLIKVQQYESFGFPSDSLTITEGKTKFLQMHVPSSSITTHVQYTSDSEKVAKVTGTDSVCQITGLDGGQTAVIKAELVAASTGLVQASANILVYCEEAETEEVYLTGTSTIYSLEKGTKKVLTATLVGKDISETDQYSIEWSSSDKSIATIQGASTTGVYVGNSCYLTAVGSGDCTINISHSKAPSALTYHIIVPDVEAADITLSKTFLKLEKGYTEEIKANINNGKSEDYKSITWGIGKDNGTEVARVMGSGQTVSIYAIAVGTVDLTASLPNGNMASMKVYVESAKTLAFDNSVIRIQPGHTKNVGYTLSPATDAVSFRLVSTDGGDYITYSDNGMNDGTGSVAIQGVSAGTETLIATSSSGCVAQLSVVCSWDYDFKLSGSTSFKMIPEEKKYIPFTVSPAEGEISMSSNYDDCCGYTAVYDTDSSGNRAGSGTIIVEGIKECASEIRISVAATNPNDNNKTIGQTSISAYVQYTSLEPVVSFISSTGKYSRFDGTNLFIGDGEKVTLGIAISQAKSDAVINKFSSLLPYNINVISTGTNSKYMTVVIDATSTDVKKPVYYVNSAKLPYWKGALLDDWTTDLYWHTDTEEFHLNFGTLGAHYYNYTTGVYSRTYSNPDIDICKCDISHYYSKSAIPKLHGFYDGDDYCNWRTPNNTYQWLFWKEEGDTVYSQDSNWTFTDMTFASTKDREFAVDDFESRALWYCPEYCSHDGGVNGACTWNKGLTPYCDAVKRISLNDAAYASGTSATSESGVSIVAGSMTTAQVEYNHLGSIQTKIDIPVYLEIRSCNKDCSEEAVE